ncbi:PAS domain S-box protein [Gramella sp. BOM4]|nr:PAS domain S-box protein [Christiangramia bathymodioli]
MKYLKIFEALTEPSLLLEYGGGKMRIHNANSEFLKLTALQPEYLNGSDICDVLKALKLPSKGLKLVTGNLEKCLQQNQVLALEQFQFNLKRNLPESETTTQYWNLRFIPVECEKENFENMVLLSCSDVSLQVEKEKKNALEMEGLKESAQRYWQYLDENANGLFSLDENGRFQSVNEGLLEIAEVSEKQMLEMNFLPFVAEHHKGLVLEYFQKALKGERNQFQADFISFKGSKVVLDISLVPLNCHGKIKGVYGIAKDITEKLKTEKRVEAFERELIKSEQKFKALVQEASDLIAIIDLNGNYKFASESCVSILGMSPEEYIGNNAFDFIHADDQAWVYEKLKSLYQQKQVNIKPFRFKNGEGEWRWLESRATNLLDDPNVEGIVVNSKDVTETYISKKEIESLNERFRLASYATEDLVYDWDLINDSIYRNRVFQINYGFGPEECLCPNKIWFDRIDNKDRKRVQRSLEAARKDPTVKNWTEEYCFLKKNGEQACLKDRAYILRDEDGKAIRMVGAVVDLTESMNYLKKIEKQNALLKELAWEQAHVIRAPLARLKVLANALHESNYECWNEDELKKFIESSVNELDEIISSRILKIEKIIE